MHLVRCRRYRACANWKLFSEVGVFGQRLTPSANRLPSSAFLFFVSLRARLCTHAQPHKRVYAHVGISSHVRTRCCKPMAAAPRARSGLRWCRIRSVVRSPEAQRVAYELGTCGVDSLTQVCGGETQIRQRRTLDSEMVAWLVIRTDGGGVVL